MIFRSRFGVGSCIYETGAIGEVQVEDINKSFVYVMFKDQDIIRN